MPSEQESRNGKNSVDQAMGMRSGKKSTGGVSQQVACYELVKLQLGALPEQSSKTDFHAPLFVSTNSKRQMIQGRVRSLRLTRRNRTIPSELELVASESEIMANDAALTVIHRTHRTMKCASPPLYSSRRDAMNRNFELEDAFLYR